MEGGINQPRLPPSKQTWIHAVNSQENLAHVLQGVHGDITAIEADLIVGQNEKVILAHPPATTSDLTFVEFLDRLTVSNPNDNSTRVLKHITKLDFKDILVVEPALQQVISQRLVTPLDCDNIVFANADIVPGPGFGSDDIDLKPDEFVPLVCSAIRQQLDQERSANIAWSLGFRTRYESYGSFRKDDLEQMNAIMEKFSLLDVPNNGVGVVLAVNARQLAKQLELFSSQFKKGGLWKSTSASQLQLLAWTGRSEPPIPQATISQIQDHFNQRNLEDRIGFDVIVSENALLSLGLDIGIQIYGFASAVVRGLIDRWFWVTSSATEEGSPLV